MAGETHPRSELHPVCGRAREWSSLALDGELSEVERALLARHLDGCPACREFDSLLQTAAQSMRAAPLEEPAVRFQPPRRVVEFPVRRRVALAAVAAAAALGSLVGALIDRPAQSPTRDAPPQVSLLTSDVKQLREIPRGRAFYPTPPAREPGFPPEGIV